MPKASRRLVHGIIDEQLVQIFAELSSPKAFAEIQRQTRLPKSSLHQMLQRLVDSRLIRKTPRGFEATLAAELILSTIRRIENWNKLIISDYDIMKAYRDVERGSALESRGYTPAQQFLDLLESVEGVKAPPSSANIR